MSTKNKKIQTQPSRRKRTTKQRSYDKLFESDGEYFLKLVLCVLLGTFWLKFSQPVSWLGVPISAVPIGLVLGIIFVSQFEKFQSDRKIWYAALVIVGIISYFVPAGIVI